MFFVHISRLDGVLSGKLLGEEEDYPEIAPDVKTGTEEGPVLYHIVRN
jgi:hypothetical protein